MENLKSVLENQANMDSERAIDAVEIIRNYFKQRVPAFAGVVIDDIIEGKSVDEQLKSKTSQISDSVQNKAGMLSNDLKNAFERIFGNSPKE